MPLRADVIDDFSGPKKFLLGGVNGDPEYVLDGQFHLNLPTPEGYAAFGYLPTYELPEGQPVEFKLDVVSLDHPQVYAGLNLSFIQPRNVPRRSVRGYGLFWLQDTVILGKGWDTREAWFLDTGHAYSPEPVTMSLTLTRQGPSLKLDTKVVRRDEPEQVIFARSVTDGTGVDVGGDNGAPPAGPVWAVWVNVGTTDRSAPGEAVFDNVWCSTDPAPVMMGIHRDGGDEVRIEWSSYHVLLEATGLAGPWNPWPQVPLSTSGAYRASLSCGQQGQFFLLASGEQWLDEFDTTWAGGSWKTASPVPAETSVPVFSQANGGGRIRGTADRNADFVMYWHMGFGTYHHCLASVDIVDWDETMADAAFGIVLRANPGKDLWYPQADGLPHDRYTGSLVFKTAGSPSQSVLAIGGPGGAVLASRSLAAVDPAKQYRLRFGAAGEQLTLELFALDSLDQPIVTCEATDARVTEGTDALYGLKSSGETYDVTIDRYMMTATFAVDQGQ